jgi:hypothetical protein
MDVFDKDLVTGVYSNQRPYHFGWKNVFFEMF